MTILGSRATSPITELLTAAGKGDAAARERLWEVVYDELHRIAEGQLAREAPGGTLQPTALINEAYLRLVGGGDADWANRRHFYAAAAKAMRRIRIDYARKRDALKRGGPGLGKDSPAQGVREGIPEDGGCERGLSHQRAVEWGARPRGLKPAAHCVEDAAVFDEDPAEVLAVDDALTKLEQADPPKAEVVMLRYFAGLSIDETAETLGVSARTVDSAWRFAKAWLHRELS